MMQETIECKCKQIDKSIVEEVSKYLDRDKAKEMLMESALNDKEESFEDSMRYGEAALYLQSIGELEKVQQEIHNSKKWKVAKEVR